MFKKGWLFIVVAQIAVGGGLKEASVMKGTKLTPLIESQSLDFSGGKGHLMRENEDKSLKEAQLFDSYQVTREAHIDFYRKRSLEQLGRLHSPEEYRLVASWIQLTLQQEKHDFFTRFERSISWSSRGERVERLIALLKQLPSDKVIVAAIYTTCFTKTEAGNRCIPGCGNTPQALMRPEILMRRATKGY